MFNKQLYLSLALAAMVSLVGCGGGGGGSSSAQPAPGSTGGGTTGGGATGGGATGGGTPTTPDPAPNGGDDARRAVLTDISAQIILPSLVAFETQAANLNTAATSYAASPTDAAALSAAQNAWQDAMAAWQRNEVLQVGPAGRTSNPDAVAGGQDFRDLIYSWPFTLDVCSLEAAAANGATVDSSTSIDTVGLGALEHLLYTAEAPADCVATPSAAARASHVERLAARVSLLATSLRNRWDSAGGNFVEQWNTAGAGSLIYAAPQDALNALSIALFYVEKETKDRKIGLTTGIGATSLVCGNQASCPEFLESRLSRRSGQNLLANTQAFRDIFTGAGGGMGLNDLLIGIDREDIATTLIQQLDLVLVRLEAIEASDGFDASVEAVDDRTECTNAFSSSSGVAPCALLGEIKTALDTFRIDVVAALNLSIPDSAAGDND